jgi:hypothetical protein
LIIALVSVFPQGVLGAFSSWRTRRVTGEQL